jgi:hypothetical protein
MLGRGNRVSFCSLSQSTDELPTWCGSVGSGHWRIQMVDLNPYSPPKVPQNAGRQQSITSGKNTTAPATLRKVLAGFCVIPAAWYGLASGVYAYECLIGNSLLPFVDFNWNARLLASAICGSGSAIGFSAAVLLWRGRIALAIAAFCFSNALVLGFTP